MAPPDDIETSEQSDDGGSIATLATAIERDMLLRGLEPGDKYLTAENVGQVLSVSRVTANRAMQWLAQRDILVRARSRGTYVGPKFKSALSRTRPQIDNVHVLLTMDHSRNVMQGESFALVLGDALPGTNLHFHYVAEYDPLVTVRQVVEQMKSDGLVDGLILVRSDQQVQRYVAESGVPAVVFGTVFPGIETLSSLDSDMADAGRQVVSYALDKGCRKFAIFFRHEWLWGDNLLLHAAMKKLSDAGHGMEDLLVRSMNPSRQLVEAEFAHLLHRLDAPTAFLCVGDYYARIAHEMIEREKPRHPVELISAVRLAAGPTDHYARVVAQKSGQEQVRMLCDILSKTLSGQSQPVQHVTIPVAIHAAGQPD